MSEFLVPFSKITDMTVAEAAKKYGTPFYLYDEKLIEDRCRQFLDMPHAYDFHVRYAMKANSTKAIIQLITKQGIDIDASSINEVKRAQMAGVPLDRILLTTQEVYLGKKMQDLENLMHGGLQVNICSGRQLELVSDFAARHKIPLSIRVHPGVGSGESSTRNTGDKYSCFGVHLSIIEDVLDYAKNKGVIFKRVHVHIGSGGDPISWRNNIDREIGFVAKHFPDATIINFGGGFKDARMPGEIKADIWELGAYAKQRIEAFYMKTGRKLAMEVEPGTFIIAMAGFLVTSVLDKKDTGPDGFRFIIVDGGMETICRPLLYGSQHPFFIVSKTGRMLFSEYAQKSGKEKPFVVAGRCCESGDSLTLDEHHKIIERLLIEPEIDNYFVVGGCGAYCSSMTPFNYNSHTQIPEILLRMNGNLAEIRKGQTLLQMTQNEVDNN